MILISLLIVLALEFHFKIFSELRDFSWFTKTRHFLFNQFSDKSFYEGWGGLLLIILLPVAVLYGFVSLFGGGLYWLIMFIVSVTVLFLSIGPKRLEESFDGYFKASESGDFEAASHHLDEINQSLNRLDTIENGEQDEIVRDATRSILIEGHTRYFGVIAWFIFFGPFGALFYRLTHLYREACAKDGFDEHLPLVEQLIHWIDWIPARLTSLLFLMTGDFVNGLYRIQDYLTDADADNSQLISETGIAALSLDMGVSGDDTNENRAALAMANRTIIFYLVVGAIVGVIL